MNPQFEINLPYVPPNIYKCVIKLWCQTNSDWKLLCLYKLNLRKMISVDNDLEILDLYKTNTLSLQLNDQWFTFQDMLNISIVDKTPMFYLNQYSHTHLIRFVV